MLLAVFAHVNAHQRIFIVKHKLGEGFGQLSFADAGGADKDEGTNRALGVFEARAGAANGVGDGGDGFVLADDAFVQTGFHIEQLLGFGLHHLANRDTGPHGDHFSDVFHIHDLVKFVLAFPFFALLIEDLLQAQALGFHLGGALVIALHAGLLFFRQGAVDLGLHFFEVVGQRVERHAQLGGGFVHQVDGLVGQVSVAHIAV